MNTSQCECGATVIGTGWGVTVEGDEIAKCGACGACVIVTESA